MTVTDHAASPAGDRTPPNDAGAEQSVLGAMMLSTDAIADIIETIGSEDFYQPLHSTIFSAIVALYTDGKPADAMTVADALFNSGDLARIGGAPYLHTLISVVPTAANGGYYANIVREKAMLRRMIMAGTRMVQLGYTGPAAAGRDVDDLIDMAQQAAYELTEHRQDEKLLSLTDVYSEAFTAAEESDDDRPRILCGLQDLDRLLGGLTPGQLVLAAGRPGMAKSVFAMVYARNAAIRQGLSTALFSLEMSHAEVGNRILSSEARVPYHLIRDKKLTEDDWKKLADKAGETGNAPMWVDDTPDMTLNHIRAKGRRLKQRHDLRLIIVDYLQLMAPGRKVERRDLEIAEISRGLKVLAKELEVPIIAVSQLNRGPETRADKRPTLADLRESGSLEQDADIVILLHRDDYYDKESPRAGECDLIVAKHRGGPTDTITVAAQLHLMRLVDMAIV